MTCSYTMDVMSVFSIVMGDRDVSNGGETDSTDVLEEKHEGIIFISGSNIGHRPGHGSS